MGGLFGHILAGAAEGIGTGIVNEARSMKEQRMAELDRDFRRRERLESQSFLSSEAEKARRFQLENQQGDLIPMGEGRFGVRRGNVVEPLIDNSGEPVAIATQPGYRQLSDEEKVELGLDPSKAYQVSKDNKISQIGGAGMTVTVNNDTGLRQTKGRTKVDERYAEDFVDWNARGAYADIYKQIGQLEEALSDLESDKELTGPVVGSLPDPINAIVNPGAIATRERVEEVVQRNLRLVLGAQFTEKEGERLIARAFNPRLSEEENAKRVRRLINQIKTAADAKQSASKYFIENGTLTGWRGTLPSLADFDPEKDIAEDAVKRSTSKPAPPVGTIKGGYRFKGGDPASESSWEPVN